MISRSVKAYARIAIFSLVVQSSAVSAQNTEIRLENKTQQVMNEVFITPSSAVFNTQNLSIWSFNHLRGIPLVAGQIAKINLDTASGCEFDFRAVYDTGKSEEKKRLNVCRVKRIVFGSETVSYMAILTCGRGNFDHINILACFAPDRGGPTTELHLKNNGRTGLYRVFNFDQSGGSEDRQGYKIELSENFSIRAQNSSRLLTLRLRIVNQSTGQTVFDDVAGQYQVVGFEN